MRLKLSQKTLSTIVVSLFGVVTTTLLSSPASASTVQASLVSQGYYISVTSNNVNINVSTTPGGTTAVGKDTLNTKTNVPSGYKLYVSMTNSTDYDTTHPGNALYLGGDSTSGNMIPPPTTGTISTPDTLAKDSWGFNASHNDSSTTPTTFSAMPLKPNQTLIQQTSSANEDPGVERDIYYGVNASFGLPSGTYSGEVTYTAMAETVPSQDENISINPNTASSNAGGEIVTITTSLYTTDTLTKDDIVAKIGGNICTIASDDDITVDPGTKTVKFTCTTPAGGGTVDVEVVIDRFGKDYVLENGYTYFKETSFWDITYMQEMTPAICNSVYTPSNATGSNVTLIETEEAYQSVSGPGTPNVPQRVLYDIRDNKPYTVRKLADGECWMTDDLAYELTAGVEAIGAYNDGSTFVWTPRGNGGTANEIEVINGNTKEYNGTWYYNWYAATAGVGQPGDTRKTIISSICPAGWRLPPNYDINYGGQAEKSFGNLLAAYGMSATNAKVYHVDILDSTPLDFTRRGYLWSGAISSSGGGNRWSGTATSVTTGAYYFNYSGNATYPQYNSVSKPDGLIVRCVAI